MNGERSQSAEPGDHESRFRNAFKRSRIAGPVAAVGLTALAAAGVLAERSPDSSSAAGPDVPEFAAKLDMEFYGERPEYVERFYESYAIADEYWRSLGYEPSSCEEELDVIFTRHFAGYGSSNLPYGAIECFRMVDGQRVPSHRFWANKNIAANSATMTDLVAHELGHARGFRHSHDSDSIMFTPEIESNRESFVSDEYGDPAPSGATVEYLGQLADQARP